MEKCTAVTIWDDTEHTAMQNFMKDPSGQPGKFDVSLLTVHFLNCLIAVCYGFSMAQKKLS